MRLISDRTILALTANPIKEDRERCLDAGGLVAHLPYAVA